jgi:hypothetical protein
MLSLKSFEVVKHGPFIFAGLLPHHVCPKKWLVQKLDSIRRGFLWARWGFLWARYESASGGQCLVNWKVVKSPKDVGGLGVLDLELFSRALRLRWLWFQFVDPDRPWVGT